MENYSFDDKFMQEGWNAMSEILDKEMPVEKKKRRLFFLWFPYAIGACLLVFGGFYFKDSLPKKQILNVISQSNSEQNLIKSNQIERKTNISNTEKNISQFTENQYTNSNRINYSTKESKIQSSFPEIIELELTSQNAKELSLLQNNEDKKNTDLVQNKKSRELVIIPNLENISKKLVLIQEPKNEILIAELIKNKIKYQKFQIAAFVGKSFNTNNINGSYLHNGFAAGLKLAKRHQKHLFEGSIFYETTQKFTPIYYQEKVVPSANPIPNTGELNKIQEVVYPWNCNCSSDFPALNDTYSKYYSYSASIKSSQIGLGIGYNYRVTKRFELNSGFSLTRDLFKQKYVVVLNSSSNISNSKIYTASATDYNADEKSAEYLNSNLNQFSSSNKEVIYFRKYDMSGYLGLSYYFTKNLKTSVLYKKGLLDITKNDVLNRKETNDFLQIQLTKYF